MTPEELNALETQLQQCKAALTEWEAKLARQAEGKGKYSAPVAAMEKPKPTTESYNPAASTFVHSIKMYVPVTLDLKDLNFAQWRELFLDALGSYGLTAHVHGSDGASPSDTSPTSDWGHDDFTVLN